jgi:hypothetical protein
MQKSIVNLVTINIFEAIDIEPLPNSQIPGQFEGIDFKADTVTYCRTKGTVFKE